MSAQPGNATLIGCIFSDDPKNGGVPYSAERKANFEIKRNPQLNYTTPPMSDPSAPSGFFASSLKFTNELAPGDYQAYVGARSTLTNGTQLSLVTVQNVTTFSILNAKMPPQAAFTYYPVDSYVGMAITFDASASTAEGYGVSLVNYQWDFGNGTKYSTATPTITNVFSAANNYTVTLNVTDSQGLWSTTTKIVFFTADGAYGELYMVSSGTHKFNRSCIRCFINNTWLEQDKSSRDNQLRLEFRRW